MKRPRGSRMWPLTRPETLTHGKAARTIVQTIVGDETGLLALAAGVEAARATAGPSIYAGG